MKQRKWVSSPSPQQTKLNQSLVVDFFLPIDQCFTYQPWHSLCVSSRLFSIENADLIDPQITIAFYFIIIYSIAQ